MIGELTLQRINPVTNAYFGFKVRKYAAPPLHLYGDQVICYAENYNTGIGSFGLS